MNKMEEWNAKREEENVKNARTHACSEKGESRWIDTDQANAFTANL